MARRSARSRYTPGGDDISPACSGSRLSQRERSRPRSGPGEGSALSGTTVIPHPDAGFAVVSTSPSGRGDARPRDRSMATLLLSTVGSAAGSALGGPIGGAVGRVLGAAAGALVDRALVGGDSPRFRRAAADRARRARL